MSQRIAALESQFNHAMNQLEGADQAIGSLHDEINNLHQELAKADEIIHELCKYRDELRHFKDFVPKNSRTHEWYEYKVGVLKRLNLILEPLESEEEVS